jgi:hypothetical protein
MTSVTSDGRKKHWKRRPGVAGVLAIVILFAMVFTTGVSYLLFINSSNQSVNQANAARQNSLLQASQEKVLSMVSVSSGKLVLSVNNTGGVPLTINSFYIVNNTGKVITPPGIKALSPPVTLQVGQSTGGLPTGNIQTGYSYTGTQVTVEMVTARGNTFGAPFPPIGPTITAGTALVVKMAASPPETLSCSNCITLNVTVYNYALSQVTNVQLSPAPPSWSATGSATITGGSCVNPSSTTIQAYPGSGNAHKISFICTFGASTGVSGGYATFSGSALGTLNGAGVSSAQAMSNTVEIGGSANPAQGAFVVNYFLVKYSACTNPPSGSVGSYSYSSPCTTTPPTMPPSSLKVLTDGNYVSAIANYYVAYYVQVTNIFNTTMPILQYSYLFMDPGASTEAYSFLVGTNKTMTSGIYYPNYNPSSPRIPTLVSYPTDCSVVNSKNVPTDNNCIYVKPGQTVTLTFAACGWGSSNWVWGGTPYASQLDNTAGCVTTPPEYQNPTTGAIQVPEGETLAIVLSYPYKGQGYSQVLPFEGQTITNIRGTSTSVSCSPSPEYVNAPTTCTATITDTSGGTPVTPSGSVAFSGSPLSGGSFGSGGTCTLGGSGASATCSLTYTPALGQESPPQDTISVSYAGDTGHSSSSGQTSLSAIQRTTATSVVCTPSSAVPNTPTTCVATVSDNAPGTASTPAGTVTFSQSPTSGAFTPASSCTLVLGTCQVTYTPNNGYVGTVTITGTYGGDFDHSGSSGSASVTWNNKKTTTVTVNCVPLSFSVGSTSQCTAQLGGFATPVTGETITFSQNGGSGSVTFLASTCSLSSLGSCSVNIQGKTSGTATIQASYPGDSLNSASSGSQSVTINSKSPAKYVQRMTVCNDPGGSSCSHKFTNNVAAGDVIVVAVSTEIGDTTCVTVNSVSGTQGDAAYTLVPGSAPVSYNGGFGGSYCAYSAIYYATVTTSGADTITVTLSGNPDNGLARAYEVNSILTPPTAAYGSCNNGNCPTTITTTSLPVTANSFLVTTASDCPDTSADTLTITGPTGFTNTRDGHYVEVAGYQLPTSSGSQSFQMKSTTGTGYYGGPPACWSIVGAQFVDPPPPQGWNSSASQLAAISHPAALGGSVAIPGIDVLSFLPFVSFGTRSAPGRNLPSRKGGDGW